MKKITLMLTAALFCLMGGMNAQTTFTGAGTPTPIPATGTGTATCSTATTSDATSTLTGTIGTDWGIDNVTIDLTHTWDSDLDISLVSPDGTSLDLSSDNGGTGDNYTNTVFQDGGDDITDASAPFTGTFAPEGGTFAETFAGENAGGIWQLSVCDDTGGDTGTLLSYEITFIECVVDLQCQDATANLDENGMLEGPFEDLVQNAEVRFESNGTTTAAVASGDTPLAIPDSNPAGATATVDVSGIGGSIGTEYLPVVTIDITHTWDSDLTLTLISPDGSEVELADGLGGSGDNYSTTVFQDGNASITTGAPPFNGSFSAQEGDFATILAGADVDGTWSLFVTDDTGGDTGTINNFSIAFEELQKNVYAPSTCGDALVTFSPNSFDCMTTGDNTVTITAGGETCTAVLTVLAGVQFDGPSDLFIGTGDTVECSRVINYDLTGEVVGCDGEATLVLTEGFESGEEFPVGTTTVSYEAQAMDGTVLDTYTFDVTVTDTAFPAIDCPGDFAVSPDDGAAVYTIPDWSALASDNCSSGDELEFVQVPAAGETVADGSMTDVTFTATDAAGNVTECSFVLTVDETLSTNDFALDSAISVYPNPVASQFTLRNGSNAQLQTITMSDVNGRVIEVIALSDMATEKQINISGYASGIYFAQITTGNATTVKRIVKQ
ncbi:T9SS C-terminal target domain-containing protein [Dokdonia sinensis]|uniref:T9SS C-terminal target domain-containing protein n=1 Tax=Dokdonia sinensis TaxID=2479847 RepID=A0A3M0H2U1_9FLAO|nr:proprotein convertase P-domain-containing protein [Dokdonia sinensis]RMB63966.1 T9SS C-terminal target domain-containing protein [Dokdonia sinensis]